jgi:hypothetical protein
VRSIARASGPPELLAFASLLLLAALLLFSVGRPLFTDDLWWHLALGRAYLANGPWLSSDPLLFAAAGPPSPAAWLFDAILAGILDSAGLNALRVFHVAFVAVLLGVVWHVLRRAGSTRSVAGLCTAAFLVLSAYRMFQLRPELATILATSCLHALLFAAPRAPSSRAIALAGLLSGIWVNLHAGFLLGPILVTAALLGVVTTLPFQSPTRRAEQTRRAGRLAIALGVVLLATLCNPEGLGAYAAYFAAGDTTPDLSMVADEWTPLNLFAAPRLNAPPAPLVWGLVWALWVATLGVGFRALRGWRKDDDRAWVDPALLSLAAAGLMAALVAVRFSWLGIFPLLLLVHAGRHKEWGTPFSWAAALCTLLLVPGYLALGDWPFLSRGVPRDLEGYATPYPANKYYASAAWFIHDTGIEGRLSTHYYQGGFYGFWLAPRVKPFINGSLNVPPAAVDDYMAIQIGHGVDSRRAILERLEANDIDLFLGVGLPSAQRPNRPWRYTTSHLEGAPGWRLVYRTLQLALYLRVSEESREQLQRIARYYAAEGVPFDPDIGFDVAAVLEQAPEWAIREGLVPTIYPELIADTTRRLAVRNKLANLYAALGLYEEAVEIDRALVQHRGGHPETARRLVWCLLHLGFDQEARRAARRLGSDPLSANLAATALRITEQPDPEQRALALAFLPLFTHAESSRIASGRVRVPARPYPTP